MENSVPKGWAEITPLEIAEKIRGVSYDKAEISLIPMDGLLPVLRANNIDEGNLVYKDLVYVPEHRISKNQWLREGDVVIAMSSGSKNLVGKTAQYLGNIKSSFGAFCGVLRPSSLINKNYFGYYFQSKEYRNKISELAAGTNINNLKNEHFEDLTIPIAPLPEQERIVAKLDALFEKIESNRQRLEKIPKILKRFRQSVLAAAVSGDLTNSEIERIPLGNLIQDLKYGTSQKSERNSKGVPILRIPNIDEGGRISIEDLKYSDLPKSEYEKLKLLSGDLLLIRSNGSVSLVGRTSIVSDKEKGFAYAGYLIRIRCNKDLILPEYLNIALASYDLRMQIEIPARSTSGVNNINSDEVKALEIPTPSLHDQQLIVERVSNLLAFADKLESRYTKAKSMLDKFPQSILAKAFRGELVSQNPNDEPASVLLERIKQEKEKLKTDLPAGKAGKPKKAKEYSVAESPVKMAAEKNVKYKINKRK